MGLRDGLGVDEFLRLRDRIDDLVLGVVSAAQAEVLARDLLDLAKRIRSDAHYEGKHKAARDPLCIDCLLPVSVADERSRP